MSTAPDDELDTWIRQLEPLRQLAEAIALARAFQLDLLICEDRRVARFALRRLAAMVSERSGTICTIEVSNAGARRSASSPYEPTALRDAIVLPLIAAEPLVREGQVVRVIDAMEAREEDEAAWREVFRALNRNRNRIASAIACPLVVCLTKHLFALLPGEAPDFWSVRTVTAVIDAHVSPVDRRAQRQRSRLLRAFERSERSFATGLVSRSREEIERTIRSAEALADRHPQRLEFRRDIAVAELFLARSLRSLGELDQAQAAVRRAMAALEAVEAERPGSAELALDRAAIHEQWSALASQLGRSAEALRHAEAALELRESALRVAPHRIDRRAELIGGLTGLAFLLAHDLSRGEEAEALARRAVALADEPDLDPQRELALLELRFSSRAALASVLWTRGATPEVEHLLIEAHRAAEAMMRRSAEEPADLRRAALALEALGTFDRERGAGERGNLYLRRALALRERALASDPEDIAIQRELAVACFLIAEAEGDLPSAKRADELFSRLASQSHLSLEDQELWDLDRKLLARLCPEPNHDTKT